MKITMNWIITLFSLIFISNVTAQQITIRDIARQWKDTGIDKMEGVYAMSDKTSGDYNKNTFYGIIRYYSSYRIFICKKKDDSICNVVGTLKKLTNQSFLSNIKINGNAYYNIEFNFNKEFNKFNLKSFDKLEFTKVYPSEKNKSNRKKEDNTLENEIEVELLGTGVFEVPVVINEALKLFFIIDTGADETQISPDVFLTLYRSHTIDESDRLEGRRFTFADGSSAFSDRYLLRSVEIGGVKIYNVTVSISNSIDAPMLLGQNVLSRLGEFHIDYENKKLIIKK